MPHEIKLIKTQPQMTLTACPSVSVMYSVVDRPKGTAMMAKLSPRTDSMDSERGSLDS